MIRYEVYSNEMLSGTSYFKDKDKAIEKAQELTKEMGIQFYVFEVTTELIYKGE
jgi:hypothetical protein